MSTLVNLDNPDVKRHIAMLLRFKPGHYFSPYNVIPREQFCLIRWAMAYDELGAVVDDRLYGLQVRNLQRQELMFPDIWPEVSFHTFKVVNWALDQPHSSDLVKHHRPDDEDWLLIEGWQFKANYDNS